jgi:hypothetical protein
MILQGFNPQMTQMGTDETKMSDKAVRRMDL